jgi:flagellar assembly protein FliH
MTTTGTKFTFDTHFDVDASAQAQSERRSRKSYSAEEIETIRKHARDEGRKDGDVRAAQAIAASVGQVASAVLAAIQAMDGEVETIRAEAASLALAAARKLAQAALAQAPEAEIVEALRAALHQAVGEPRVLIKTTPKVASAIESRVAEIAAEQGFEGRVQFAPDASLADADCRIEWRGGGLERAHAMIDNALADVIARRFSHTSKNSEVEE